MAVPPIPPRDRLVAPDIRFPLSNHPYIAAGVDSTHDYGTIRVVVRSVGSHIVIGRITAADVADGQLPDNVDHMNPLQGLPEDRHFFRLIDPNGNGDFVTDAGKVRDLPWTTVLADSDANNKRVHARAYDGTGAAIGEPASVAFIAVPETTLLGVDARNCIFLTYDDSGTALPHGEVAGDTYSPRALVIPDDANQVRVQADGAQMWRHGPGLDSGPGGRADTENVAAGYRTAGHKSSSIVGLRLRLNRLVGLWEYADWNLATTELDIGTEATLAVAPACTGTGPVRPVRLRLGMHDGFEWSNNSGEITATVTWIV